MMTRFVYDPPHDHAATIGWVPPILDLHDRPLVDGKFVQPDTNEFDSKVKRIFTAGEPFDVDNVTESHLHQLCVADRRFRIAKRSDLPAQEAA